MILADTSIWVEHLSRGHAAMTAQLEWGNIVAHPAVIGELACGSLDDRKATLHDLRALPVIMEAEHEEVLEVLDRHRLAGTGIGWVDAHLLASAMLNDVRLWTLDRRLRSAAERLRVHASL
jgi:predicted nucleic acid-binding protein